MTEEEVGRLLAELEELLTELGLGFIVTQERVLTAEGISLSPAEAGYTSTQSVAWEAVVDDVVATLPDDLAPELSLRGSRQRPRSRFKSEDAVVRPLDTRTRLGILLDLIEVTTAGTLTMERTVYDEIGRFRMSAASGSPAEANQMEPVTRVSENPSLTWGSAITFSEPPEAELRGQVREPWTLSSRYVSASKAMRVNGIVDILEELRERADLSRGQWLEPHAGHASNETGWDLDPTKEGS